MAIVRKLLSIVINCEEAVTILISSNSRSISCCSWRSLSWLPTLSRPALVEFFGRNSIKLRTGNSFISSETEWSNLHLASVSPRIPSCQGPIAPWTTRMSGDACDLQILSSSNMHYHTLSPSSLMYTIIIHHHPFWHNHHPQDQPPDLTGQCSSSPFPHQPPELSSRNPCFTKSTWSGGSWSRSSPRSPTWPTAGQTLAHRALVKISPISEWRVLFPHTARLGNNCTLTSVAYKFTAMSSTKLLQSVDGIQFLAPLGFFEVSPAGDGERQLFGVGGSPLSRPLFFGANSQNLLRGWTR